MHQRARQGKEFCAFVRVQGLIAAISTIAKTIDARTQTAGTTQNIERILSRTRCTEANNPDSRLPIASSTPGGVGPSGRHRRAKPGDGVAGVPRHTVRCSGLQR